MLHQSHPLKYQLKKHLISQYDVDNTSNNIYARNYANNNINRRINQNNNQNNSSNHNINNNPINVYNQFDGIRVLRRVRNNLGPIGENWNGEGLSSRWDN